MKIRSTLVVGEESIEKIPAGVCVAVGVCCSCLAVLSDEPFSLMRVRGGIFVVARNCTLVDVRRRDRRRARPDPEQMKLVTAGDSYFAPSKAPSKKPKTTKSRGHSWEHIAFP